ncbi:MAG: type IX secretion system membrane protein PorP/SprF [Bacteroidales bacterium]|nr:type IX secretion system membrane protein PorP/SprF [Lentimicrobiaceae bacterium]MDD5695320.1 type IX secretion system membrane protein PorP/SprF [Bacteroidales bacterium]
MKKYILIYLFLLIGVSGFGQRDALYYQYLHNYHILNPAFTGIQEKPIFNLVDRHQWVGLNGAPNTITLSGQALLPNEKVGIGGYLYVDRLGPVIDYGLITTYNYIVDFTEGKLSLGLQFGFKHSRIDWQNLSMEDMNDYYLIVQPQSVVLPDANFGVYYYTPDFFIGFSTKHMFDKYFSSWYDLDSKFFIFKQNLFLYTGGFIKINKTILKPSILIKYWEGNQWGIDLNTALKINNLIWVGVSYRSNTRSFVLLTEVRVSSRLKIGYSFDSYLGDIGNYNVGSHEIKLCWDKQTKKKPYVGDYF